MHAFNNIREHCYGQPIPKWSTISIQIITKCDKIKEEEKDQVENNQTNIDQPTKVTAFPRERYSSFTKLIRQIALMKLFVRMWKSKTQSCI